jgi:hypothetical protein
MVFMMGKGTLNGRAAVSILWSFGSLRVQVQTAVDA